MPRPETYPERNARIRELRASREKLEYIGALFGISGKRVYSIVHAETERPSRTARARGYRAAKRAAAEEKP